MNVTEKTIYSEVYALIKMMGYEYENMLPNKVKLAIENKRDKDYNPQYSLDIPLEKQKIQIDSLAILTNIQYNYWCKTDEEKRELIEELKQIDNKKEQELREVYNPDNLFKIRTPNIQTEKQESVALTKIHDDTVISKIIGFFNRLFKKISGR